MGESGDLCISEPSWLPSLAEPENFNFSRRICLKKRGVEGQKVTLALILDLRMWTQACMWVGEGRGRECQR